MNVILDTSGLLAAVDLDSPDNAGCKRVLDTLGVAVVSPMVLTELDHLSGKRFGKHARTQLMAAVARQLRTGRFILAGVTLEVLDLAEAVQQQYQALDLDLADAVNVGLAAEYGTNQILTIDRRDFRAITPVSEHAAFRLLPDDL